jgi:hypothetical protein
MTCRQRFVELLKSDRSAVTVSGSGQREKQYAQIRNPAVQTKTRPTVEDAPRAA